MSKQFFTQEDFRLLMITSGYVEQVAADIANEKLAELIESWPEVTGSFNGRVVNMPFGSVLGSNDSHTARLAFIEPIVKEPCKHEPELINQKTGGWFCKHCGVLIVADWKVK